MVVLDHSSDHPTLIALPERLGDDYGTGQCLGLIHAPQEFMMTTTQVPPIAIDEQISAAFAEHLIDILNSGAISAVLSIGHRTGLLDTMATSPAATSTTIAETAGLNERYVREWLGAMVTGRIVSYDPAHQT